MMFASCPLHILLVDSPHYSAAMGIDHWEKEIKSRSSNKPKGLSVSACLREFMMGIRNEHGMYAVQQRAQLDCFPLLVGINNHGRIAYSFTTSSMNC